MFGDNEVREQLKELLVREDNNILLVKEVKLSTKSKETRKFDGEIKFNPKQLIETIAKLFYEKGRPVTVKEITERLNIERARKFGDRVIKSPLKDAVKWIKLGGERAPDFFYPSAVLMIFKDKDKVILDSSVLPFFYETLQELSKAVKVNLCRHTRSLSEFLSRIGKDENIVIFKLVEITKKEIAKGYYTGKDYCAGFSTCEFERDLRRAVLEYEFARGIPFTRIGDLFLEFCIWFGDGEEEFRYGDITCEYDEREILQLPAELQPLIERIIERKMKEARDKRQTYDDNPLYRLVDVRLERPVIDETKKRVQKLRLFLGPTSFFPYSATNLMLKEITLKDENGRPISLWKKSVQGKNLKDVSYLRESKLPNPLGVALAVLTNDSLPKILLHKRSGKVFMGLGKYSLPAEMMIRGVDVDEDKVPPEPSPFITAKRCLWDELHVEVKKEDIKFLVLGIRLDYLQPQLLGVVELKINGEELLKRMNYARDKWEVQGVQLVEFSLNEELKNILMLEEKAISSTAKMTIIYALINKYGFKHVDNWLTTIK
jgi:hypothetical protein